MVAKTSSSDVNAPNINRESISDRDLNRGFILALGAGGRKPKTLTVYQDSIWALSEFAGSLGLPGLAAMNRTHIRHWLTSLHQKGNKPATVSVRYRSLNRFLTGASLKKSAQTTQWTVLILPKFPARSRRTTSLTKWKRT